MEHQVTGMGGQGGSRSRQRKKRGRMENFRRWISKMGLRPSRRPHQDWEWERVTIRPAQVAGMTQALRNVDGWVVPGSVKSSQGSYLPYVRCRGRGRKQALLLLSKSAAVIAGHGEGEGGT